MLRGEGGSCIDCQAHQPGTAAAGEGVSDAGRGSC